MSNRILWSNQEDDNLEHFTSDIQETYIFFFIKFYFVGDKQTRKQPFYNVKMIFLARDKIYEKQYNVILLLICVRVVLRRLETAIEGTHH